ncbi:MAG: PEP-CTERM system histidine kinase PrsK [Burkholderiaceae bacterium]|nr:PEP-CTERM system histidine kinase PrsK [Burkholderiaceae bacterium]
METSATDLAALGYLIAALVHTAFAIRLLQARSSWITSSPAALAFACGIGAGALWGWTGFAMQYWQAAWLPQGNAVADLLRYACWFTFVLSLLSPQGLARQTAGIRLLSFAAALMCFSSAALLIGTESLWPDSWTLTKLSLYAALTLPVFGLILVEQFFRNVPDDSRWNAKPVCFGLGLAFVFDLYFYSQAVLFGRYDEDAVSIRGGIHALSVPLLYVASKRHVDWIAKLQVSRKAAFHSATLLLAGVYLLFVSGVGYYVRYSGGGWGRALQLALLFVALVTLSIIMFSGAMRAKLRVFVGKHFFSYRYDYREEWLRFTSMLSVKSSPQEMGGLVVRGLANFVESPGGSLWTRGTSAMELVQSARWNLPATRDSESTQSPFIQFVQNREWIVDLDECRAFPERHGELSVPNWLLSNAQYWLVVPLIVGDELIGLAVLAKARTSIEVNWEVRDLLKTASRQAASYLAQMHATEALLEVRKFDAFNRMSAFVVHDLKNIVTQLSLMMKNAKRLHDNPEFQQDMLATVENSLEKMRQLMLQLREGERPPGGVSGVDLLPIAHRLEKVASGRGRDLELQLSDRIVTRGHDERVERVLGHVVQNALDATAPTDRVWLKLERRSGQARIEIGDTGHGMSQEFIRERLFKPFQTTKASGMGIGAYESFQYLRELGGSISVDSEVNRGTVVTILLPLFETSQKSDLNMLGSK